jgi:hypothetical protein
VIALASSAPPSNSLLNLQTAAAPKTEAGSPFHSILQSVSDESDGVETKAVKKDSTADKASAVAVSQPQQRGVKPPVALKTAPANETSDSDDEETPDAPSTLLAAKYASGGPMLTAAAISEAALKTEVGTHFHSMPPAGTNSSDRPKEKSSKKDPAANDGTVAAVPVPPERTTTLPITLNILPAKDSSEKSDGDDSESPSNVDEKHALQRTAEASTEPSAALWVEPRIKAEGRNAPEAQPDLDPKLAVAASAADGSLSKIEPAFEVHLQPAQPQESAPAAAGPMKNNATELTGPAAAVSVEQAESSNSKHGDGSHHPGQEKPQEAASDVTPQFASAGMAQAGFDINAPAPPVAAATSSTHAAGPSESQPTAEPATASELQPKAVTPAAHDIKLELNSGGQRVEVSLTERGGDIHVAVRSSDARLSDAMRQDLPALTSKLEQSGFRADAWQPGAAASGERRAVDVAAGNSSQDSQQQAGQHSQQKQDNPQQQNQKNPTTAPNRKSDRKDFEWLLQTYR